MFGRVEIFVLSVRFERYAVISFKLNYIYRARLSTYIYDCRSLKVIEAVYSTSMS